MRCGCGPQGGLGNRCILADSFPSRDRRQPTVLVTGLLRWRLGVVAAGVEGFGVPLDTEDDGPLFVAIG